MNGKAFIEELPEHLKALAAGLDELAATSGAESDGETPPNLTERDFRIKRLVGRGGMGSVYLAEQISLEREVAVKVLSARLVGSDREKAQFAEEAKVIALLHHPGIVKVLGAGEAEGRCYYAMEFIDGARFDKCRFKSGRVLAGAALKTAEALAYAHSRGILHRDIKPANIFMDKEGGVHVGDFGIAFRMKSGGTVFEDAGRQSGTVDYMAPERLARGENTVRTDIYSLGVTLRDVAKASGLKLDRELSAIVYHCAAYSPEERYPTMDAVADDLRHYLRHEPVEAAHPSVFRRFALWGRRNPVYGALVSAAVAAVALWGAAEAVAYARLVRARSEISALAMPSADEYSRKVHIDLKRILERTERLLGRYPNDPEIVAHAVRLFNDYAEIQRSAGLDLAARREKNRLITILEIFYWNSDISDAVRETLISLQLERLSSFGGVKLPEVQMLGERIERELREYHGPRKDEFAARLKESLAKLTPPTPEDMRRVMRKIRNQGDVLLDSDAR